MEAGVRIQWLRRVGAVVVVMTFALMVLGSWVKATGSGLACPDWPKCYGEWLPPFPSMETGGIDADGVDHADSYTQAQVVYEWAHRGLASLLGIPFLFFSVLAVTGRELHPLMRWTPAAAFVVLGVQVILGGSTVLRGNPASLTTLHLATATLFFFLVTAATMVAYLRPLPGQPAVVVKREAGEVRTVYPGEEAPDA